MGVLPACRQCQGYVLMYEVSDDAKLIAEILRRDWPTAPGVDPPQINYEREKYAVNAREGSIFVEASSIPEDIASSDYSTVNRNARASVTISCRFRDTMFDWTGKVCRILYNVRRAGWKELAPYTFLTIPTRRPLNNASGWYTMVVEIRLTGYHIPIEGDGLGDCSYKCTE